MVDLFEMYPSFRQGDINDNKSKINIYIYLVCTMAQIQIDHIVGATASWILHS